MPKPESISISKVTRYQNAALNYYLGLTDSPYLHYGYWETLPVPAEELTIGRLRIAQEAYAAKLFGFHSQRALIRCWMLAVALGEMQLTCLSVALLLKDSHPIRFNKSGFSSVPTVRPSFHLTNFENFKGNPPL
jgi:MPBQ/MSBQ methyltransferase